MEKYFRSFIGRFFRSILSTQNTRGGKGHSLQYWFYENPHNGQRSPELLPEFFIHKHSRPLLRLLSGVTYRFLQAARAHSILPAFRRFQLRRLE